MATSALITWVCDRCGRETAGDDDYRPHGWRNIRLGSVSGGGLVEQATMCAACEGAFRAWWRPEAEGAAEATPTADQPEGQPTTRNSNPPEDASEVQRYDGCPTQEEAT